MSLRFAITYFVFIICSTLFLSFNTPTGNKNKATAIQWMTMQQALDAHKTKPKKLLIDIYTDWCGWCKKMDKDIYENEQIAAYVNKNYYPVKFNAEAVGDITFKNKTFKLPAMGGRATHEFTQVIMQSGSGYPTTCFMDDQLTVLQSIPGYIDVKMMNMIVKYFGDNHYKTTEWGAYQSNFK